ncbi:MFS transporter [Corynebacterium sp. 3HC-13]|uniref:MFS transporter n=1 Tax=Corynebacterium poyangense TaxID=2684405 RepID=UPI001CCFFF3B|nr:MFS transporter [Corynebacterium poyangense]MBZ8176397.1 MFS transporter [Corynebacterium poyangense]
MGSDTTNTQRWLFLAIISVGLFLVGADNSILYTALPTLERELSATALEGLWMINAYPLVLCGLLLGTGTLGDRIGHRLMFLIGVLVFGLASFFAAFASNAWLLIAARACLGVGAATMMPASLALIQITFLNEQQRNTAIGIWGSVGAVGAATGPLLGGLLLQNFWWGSVFLINVPVAIGVFFATIAIAPANVANPSRHWDLPSSLYAMLAMVGAVMLIKETAHNHRQLWVIVVSLLATILGGWAFSSRQKKLTTPLLSLDIFRNRMFSGGVLTAGAAMFCLSGIELTTTQRFQLIGGYTPLEAGLLVALVALSCVPASVLGGANLHRIGFLPLISGGFVLLASGLGLALWAFQDNHQFWFFLALVAVGLGAGSVMSVSSTAIIGSAPPSKAGMASAVEAVSYEFGTLLAVAILGSLTPLFYRLFAPPELSEPYASDPRSAAAYDTGYFVIIALVIIVALIAAIITAWCFRTNPKRAYVPEGVLLCDAASGKKF